MVFAGNCKMCWLETIGSFSNNNNDAKNNLVKNEFIFYYELFDCLDLFSTPMVVIKNMVMLNMQ